MTEPMTDGVINIKPASHSFEISAQDNEVSVTMAMKINRNNIRRLTDILPLIHGEASTIFRKFKTWIDIPVDITVINPNISTFDRNIEISGKTVIVERNNNDVTFSLDGFNRSVNIKLADLIEALLYLVKEVLMSLLPKADMFCVASDLSMVKPYRGSSLRFQSSMANATVALWRDDYCVVSDYHVYGNGYVLGPSTRFSSMKVGLNKYFEKQEDGTWLRVNTSLDAYNLHKETQDFTVLSALNFTKDSKHV